MMNILSRKEAHSLGLKRYRTGRPCSNGHDAERFVTTGGCVRCNAERSTLFRKSTNAATISQLRGWFGYPLHPEDFAAALAYCQGLDLQRGRTPHVPTAAPMPEEITPERMREMRRLALGKVVDLVEEQERPKIDSSMAWMRDTVFPRPKT